MIILYSTNCPKCKILKAKLNEKNICFEEINDVDIMINKGLQSAPYLEINGKLYNFSESIDWIKEI